MVSRSCVMIVVGYNWDGGEEDGDDGKCTIKGTEAELNPLRRFQLIG